MGIRNITMDSSCLCTYNYILSNHGFWAGFEKGRKKKKKKKISKKKKRFFLGH